MILSQEQATHACERSYEMAFAFYYPLMQKRWTAASSPAALAAAKADVAATLELHWEPSAYTGKLMAEMDAIRDAELAKSRRSTR